MYEYSQEPNDYGLVKISTDGSVVELPDYATLSTKFATIPKLPTALPTTSLSVPDCKALTFTAINGSLTLPSLPEIEALIEAGVDVTIGKLSDITLRPSKYIITDMHGNEVTQKTPKKKSGLSTGVDLSAELKAWAPSEVTSDSTNPAGGKSSSSSSDGKSADAKSSGSSVINRQNGFALLLVTIVTVTLMVV